MSSAVITPIDFAPNLAMYMDAAAIGRLATGLEGGRVVFDGLDSGPTELERLVEYRRGADRIELARMIERGSSNASKGDISKIFGEVGYVQGIADATVRRKERKGNFRKEAETSFEWARKFSGLPKEDLGTREASGAFLEAAFFYTSFNKFEDRTRAYDLFISAAESLKRMKRHTAAAVVYELAWEMLREYREEALTVFKLRRDATEAWLASIDEYIEPDSLRFRAFRGLVHSSLMPSRRAIQELLLALANQDFEDDAFYEGYANHIRGAYVISNHEAVERHEWRAVKELLEGAAIMWDELEGAEIDISEPLMQLARAAEDFASGRDQHIVKPEKKAKRL